MPKITIKILRKGDSVISVTEKMIAVKRKNGEVDIIPLIIGEGFPRVDLDNITTISYGTNTIETLIDSDDGDVKVITF